MFRHEKKNLISQQAAQLCPLHLYAAKKAAALSSAHNIRRGIRKRQSKRQPVVSYIHAGHAEHTTNETLCAKDCPSQIGITCSLKIV